MGCTCASAFDRAFNTEQFQEWMRQFSAMQLSKREIRKLWYIFKKIDVDGSGNIGLAELLTHIDLERTRFTEKIFSIFDEDGSGEIDFREFVLSLWNYCTLTKATLDMFAFDLYDNDSSGELSASEVARMLQDIYGKKEVKNNFLAKSVAADLKQIENSGQLLNIDQYRTFVKTHQALLFPAFQMQLALQRRILGVRFWERNANKRLKFSNGKYISIGNFILFNVDAKKKTLLAADAPTAVAMHGANHMDQDVSKMMEVAGTKAARRQTVILNEQHFEKSFGGNMGGVHQELFSVKLKPGYDTSIPMNETSKKAWLTAIFAIRPSFTGTPSGGSVKKSTKSAKQIVVSQKSSQKSAAGTLEAPSANSSTKPRRNSRDNDVMDFSGEEENPRKNSKDHGHAGIAETERGVKSSTKNAAVEGSRKRGKEDAIPSGRIKNPALTKDAVARIDQVSPIEAWQNQSMASVAASSVSSKSGKKPSAAVTAGIAAVTSSMKYQIGAVDRGGAGGGGPGGGDASAGISAGRSAKKKHYTAVEAFDMSGFSDEEKDVSGSSKPPARRNSLSKHPGTSAHNSTWAETTVGTSAGAAIGIGGSFSTKRR